MPSPLRLLHLEDNLHDGELVELLLTGEWPDCRLRRVQGRQEFLAALETEAFDLILSDFSLPQFDGLTALKLVRERDRDVPFIFLSGTIGEENAVQALRHGATDYIIKDRPGRLVPAVRRAMEDVGARRERRQVREQLHESESRFRQLAEQSPDVFWFVDVAPERVVYVSPAYAEVWGESPGQLSVDPRRWLQSVHADERARVERAYVACLSGRADKFEQEFRLVRADGSVRWIADSGTVIREGGRIVRLCGIAKDITEKQLLTQQFLRAQRLESIGTLAGGIAHDLNNVLAPMLMAVELVKHRSGDPEVSRLMGVLEASGRHGADLIKQVLAFARGAEGARAPLQVPVVVREVVTLLSETLPRAIAVETELAPDLPAVSADRTQLNQVLMNLCVNARDAMPEGGTLRLTVTAVNVGEAQAASHGSAAPGWHVLLSVADSGTGIPAAIMDRIFDPFFTTKAAGHGTGLGLATVIGIVRDHGGFVEVASEPGAGTTFRIYLPALERDTVHSRPPLETKRPAKRRSGTILVIDDEASLRQITCAFLETSGYEVLLAEDGIEGLERFRSARSRIIAVVTDMMMPRMQGDEVIAQLRALEPELPIVATTGVLNASGAREEDRRLIYLPKPMSGSQLLDALERVTAAPGA